LRVAQKPEPLRVVSIIKRLHIGGDQIRLLNFARTATPDRVDHVIVTTHPVDVDDARVGPLFDDFARTHSRVVFLDEEVTTLTNAPDQRSTACGLGRDLARLARIVRRTVDLLRVHRAQVVDARLEFGTAVGLLAGRLARVPVVVSTGYGPDWWRPPLLSLVGQASFGLIDGFISDATTTVEAYERWRWSPRAKLAMIPNGISPATSDRSRGEMRSYFGLPEDPAIQVIGQICRIYPLKGYETFLRAARLIADSRDDVYFLACGPAEDPAYLAELLALRRQLGLDERVVFTHYPGPVGDALRAIDVYLRVSRFESSPIGVHEAMSVGLPVVASDVGGIRELVQHGETGFIVPVDDPQATVEAASVLLADRTRATEMGRLGQCRFMAHHQPEVMVERSEEFFRDLLEAKGRKVWLPASRSPSSRGRRPLLQELRPSHGQEGPCCDRGHVGDATP
jgi:glycosyltransferase involved in cell wall biosynthesis